MFMAASCLVLFFTFLVQLVDRRTCLAAGRIPIGSKLSATENQSWVSDNGTFAFGFASMDAPNELQLAIWYAGLPGDQTIVWSPNRDSPVGRNATLELDSTGNLALIDRNSLIWTSNTSGQGVEAAVMLDSGSFILYNSTLHVVWQSFSHPSDTLLPGQPLTISSELTTPNSRSSYYSLKMLQQTTSLSLALTYNLPTSDTNSPESYSNYSYWSSPEISNATGEVTAHLDGAGNFGIVYGRDPAGTVYVYKNDGSSMGASSGNRTVLRRLTIETNGNLRLYRWDYDVNGSSQWVVDWAAVSNPCSVAGICGNGICNLNGSKTNSSCSCPPGASLVGPGSVGCFSNLSPPLESCDTQRSGFKMATVPATNYYFSEDSIIMNYSDIQTSSKCAESCLLDCDCIASVYGLSEEMTYCWILRSMVFGGSEDPSSTFFVKVGVNSSSTAPGGGNRRYGPPSPSGESESHHEKVLVIPIVLCMFVIIGFLCFLLYRIVNKRRLQQNAINGNLTVPGAPRNFSFRDLQIATSNFSQMLGSGGFGRVYKGSLGDGTLVAVKKLERVLPHGEKEFITEVTTIGSMHHMNLVRLCGFCSMGSHRLLVYEFMSNGSLDKWIFPSQNNRDRLLDWKTRFQIAIGTAQGIAYFHEQCRNRIIHCDIKPENILLDENFCPKVSDFGLAKLMGREHSQVVTMIRGTRGYLAPEWVSNRPITVKADVYSYGMLLLEIIGGRRNVDMSLESEDFFFPGWAFKEMTIGRPTKVADKRLKGKVEQEELVMAMNVAFWCIQEEISMRPSMGEVVKMLEGSLEVEPPPMPQSVLELVEEGLDNVYKAMKREFNNNSSFTINSRHQHSSFTINTQPSSHATCSYSTMSPR
ncbi:G-type lectin S-receptor-like serine/threonine-protein kinase At5g24080 [Magnolia sinica]|uniref:G-type lectin S-receptor-like serine/threonine-protein kinase At5g24080 n=1 Tax=Magnolia sinica TaxID=86752 RepID=UPI002657ADF0|nr:G-type lectin S-receptor-like serine/threonine-protein kinase At5g24080 [Magnolia sinica]